MKKPYEFKTSEDMTDLYVYGEITSYELFESDKSSWSFKEELMQCNTDLTVHVNSYGGEVKEGLSIYNLIREYSQNHHVTTICDGFACSIASVIFLAGDTRVMNAASLMMIHNAWSCVSGNADDLEKAADDLRKITQPSVEIYKSHSNLTEDEIKDMMHAETWITAAEALDYGFATEVRSDNAKQSINEHYLGNAIMRIKDLEKELKELKEAKEPVNNDWFNF